MRTFIVFYLIFIASSIPTKIPANYFMTFMLLIGICIAISQDIKELMRK